MGHGTVAGADHNPYIRPNIRIYLFYGAVFNTVACIYEALSIRPLITSGRVLDTVTDLIAFAAIAVRGGLSSTVITQGKKCDVKCMILNAISWIT